MKETAKNILKLLHIYHPLQAFYRNAVFNYRRSANRKKFKKYEGSGFTCNICNARYSIFVPDYPAEENRQATEKNNVVAGYGENIFCPNCMSTARERLVILKIAELDWKKKKILHLSPEKNVYHFIKAAAEVTTADLLPGFYKTIDGMVQKQDATHFSFVNDYFDIIIANHILEHIPDDKKAMKEIYRVLKPGGKAILQVPYTESMNETLEIPGINDAAKQSRLFGQKDHVRIYSLSNYIFRLAQTGFTVNVIPYGDLKKYYPFAIQERECFIDISKPANA
jgi:SAM-dependent methyltransferase